MSQHHENLEPLVYAFFFAFSRLEFALKENGFLENPVEGARAKPGWTAFVDTWKDQYQQTTEGRDLVDAKPKLQFVGQGKLLEWRPLEPSRGRSELGNTIDALHVVRNNLFHGGKHGERSWDDPERTRLLLTCGLAVLDRLADLDGNIRADFLNRY